MSKTKKTKKNRIKPESDPGKKKSVVYITLICTVIMAVTAVFEIYYYISGIDTSDINNGANTEITTENNNGTIISGDDNNETYNKTENSGSGNITANGDNNKIVVIDKSDNSTDVSDDGDFDTSEIQENSSIYSVSSNMLAQENAIIADSADLINEESYQEAYDTLNDMLKNITDLPDSIMCAANYNLAIAELHLQKSSMALTAFMNIPENRRGSEVHYGIGVAYYFGGEYDKALKEFRIAADLQPENKNIQDAIKAAEKKLDS